MAIDIRDAKNIITPSSSVEFEALNASISTQSVLRRLKPD
jgi:hypothetical protein